MKYKKSPLKWVGSKALCLPEILSRLPKGECLVEPFVGSGTIFLNTDYDEYRLSDSNVDLINFYQQLTMRPDTFIDDCKAYFTEDNNDYDKFYYIRDEVFNKTNDQYLKALLFLYLNRHCFNGLCRYNLSGKFNVAFGKYKNPYFPEEELIHLIEKSKKAGFICCNFEVALKLVNGRDVVYADPPYSPLADSVCFTGYNGGTFTRENHKTLLDMLTETNRPFAISNHYTEETKLLYNNLEQHTFNVRRTVSCKGDGRKLASELLAFNY